MPSIIQIGPYPVDYNIIRGGVESSVFGLAQELSKTNEVVVLDIPRTGIEDRTERYENMQVCRFHNPGNHIKDFTRRIDDYVRIVLDSNPKVCHIHGTSVFNWKLCKQIRQNNIPVVLTVHGLAKIEKRQNIVRHLSIKTLYQYIVQSYAERQLLQAVPKIIVDTEYVKNTILEYQLKHKPEIIVIPQGIQKRFFNLRCADNTHTILSVGAYSERKGQLLLVKAFEEMAGQMPYANLILCGTIADEKYYNAIVEYIANSHFANRITIRTNASQDELDELYQQAGLFALYSSEESQGIALLEAMATGLPIVATRVGGISDVVEDGENGVLVEYDDVSVFSQALSHILSDRIVWNKMSQTSRLMAKNYSWSAITKSIKALYFNNGTFLSASNS